MTWYGATVRELITDQLEELLRDKCTGLRQRKKARALSAWYACRMETTKAGRKQTWKCKLTGHRHTREKEPRSMANKTKQKTSTTRNQQKELRKAKATAQARGAGGKSQETKDRGKEETVERGKSER